VIQRLRSPLAVPLGFERLNLRSCGAGKTPQRQDRRPDRHARGGGAMPDLAMRTPQHRWQDLSGLADRLERRLKPVAETEQSVQRHGGSPCLLHDRDPFGTPDPLGLAGRHRLPPFLCRPLGALFLPPRAWGGQNKHRDTPTSSPWECCDAPCYPVSGSGSGRARYVRMSSFILSNSNKYAVAMRA